MIPEDFRLAVYVVLSALSWVFWRCLAILLFVGIPLAGLAAVAGLLYLSTIRF